MNLNLIEDLVKWIGSLMAVATLGVIFNGIWRGLHRPVGSTTGGYPGLLRKPTFYIIASLGFFGVCYLLWRPILPNLSPPARVMALILGALLYFTGLALIIWGRLALGRQYFVSTSQAAQLFIDHQLVTHGPFALVRHPMYLGILLTGLGGILIYRTYSWKFLSERRFPA